MSHDLADALVQGCNDEHLDSREAVVPQGDAPVIDTDAAEQIRDGASIAARLDPQIDPLASFAVAADRALEEGRR